MKNVTSWNIFFYKGNTIFYIEIKKVYYLASTRSLTESSEGVQSILVKCAIVCFIVNVKLLCQQGVPGGTQWHFIILKNVNELKSHLSRYSNLLENQWNIMENIFKYYIC